MGVSELTNMLRGWWEASSNSLQVALAEGLIHPFMATAHRATTMSPLPLSPPPVLQCFFEASAQEVSMVAYAGCTVCLVSMRVSE